MSGPETFVDNGRRDVRYDLKSIRAEFQNRACNVIDVSERGLRLAIAGAVPPTQSEIEVTLNISLFGRNARMLVHGHVVRAGGDEFALNYMAPINTWLKILRFLDRKEKSVAVA
ncbi:MAG: PilZ domain-containing protein [Proteobacteria bacterium]|nr:PilZ domain-containing protein [Pseudomonadota bacterium]